MNIVSVLPTTQFSAVRPNAANATSGSTAQLDTPEQRKLKKAASDFEAMLLAKWWSSMKQSGLGTDDDSDPGHDTLDQMGMQAMSSAVAARGGLGIASMLVHSLLSNPRRGAASLSGMPSANSSNNKA